METSYADAKKKKQRNKQQKKRMWKVEWEGHEDDLKTPNCIRTQKGLEKIYMFAIVF